MGGDKLVEDLIYGRITKKEYKDMREHKYLAVGTRIKHYSFGEGVIKHYTGKRSIGIEFDKNIEGHNLEGKCKSGHGWYIPAIHIIAYFDTTSNTWVEVNQHGNQ